MARIVSEEEIGKVKEYVEKHLPDSIIVFEVICRILEGHNPGFRVWVSDVEDRSEFNVIVVSADPKKCQNPFYRRFVHLYCTDPTEISQTLLSPGVVNFGEHIKFFGISEFYMSYIASMEVWQDYDMVYNFICYHYWCFDESKIPLCPLPDGFTHSKITTDIAKLIISTTWEANVQGSETALQELIEMNFPSVCLYNNDGRPIAWSRKKFWGDVGSLYVAEPYRRRGIGRYVAACLARMVLEKEGKVYVRVGIENEISQRLCESIGFTKDEKKKFIVRDYSPK